MGAKVSKEPKTVAVCGATGKQGGATLDALLKLGFKVKALTRDPSSAKSAALAAKEGVAVVKADFDDIESLKAAFEGCDAVFAVTDFWQACGLDPLKEKAQGINLVDAAAATGVKHFVFSSLEDTRPQSKDLLQPITGPYTVPHFDAKAEVDHYMREKLPGKWTSVITSIFYENLLPNGGMNPNKQPDGSFALFLPTGDATLSWCTTTDIGNVAAAVIKAGPKKYVGKVVPVAGDHASLKDVADKFTKVTGVQVNAATPPADVWVGSVTSFGVPELVAKDLANMCIFYEKVGMLENRSLKETKKIYPGVESLEQWLEKNKSTFVEALK